MTEENTETVEDTTTEIAVDADDGAAEKKAREPKKGSIPAEEIAALVDGIPQYEKTSFLVVGHRDGVRIALPKTSGVSRAYFYANGNYALVPLDEAITIFTEEQRKEQRKGGIMAEVNFEHGTEAARRALGKLVDAVRAAPAPIVKEPKVKVAKAPKAPKAVTNAPTTEDKLDAELGTDAHTLPA